MTCECVCARFNIMCWGCVQTLNVHTYIPQRKEKGKPPGDSWNCYYTQAKTCKNTHRQTHKHTQACLALSHLIFLPPLWVFYVCPTRHMFRKSVCLHFFALFDVLLGRTYTHRTTLLQHTTATVCLITVLTTVLNPKALQREFRPVHLETISLQVQWHR